MCLLDTIDGAMMLALYTSTSLASDKIAILYYSIVLTIITVIIAVIIGVIQLLSLILIAGEPTGKFWDGVTVAREHYDIIGRLILPTPPKSWERKQWIKGGGGLIINLWWGIGNRGINMCLLHRFRSLECFLI